MTQIIAHRGGRSLAPENTLAAAETARRLGADLWETDITLTSDHRLILFHDATLTRTTDVAQVFPHRATHQVLDYTLEEIRRLRPGVHFHRTDPFGEIASGQVDAAALASFRDAKVPTLEEALAYTRDLGFPVNLELKQLPKGFERFPLPGKVLDTIKIMAVPRELIRISSFHHPWLRQIEQLAPDITVQALVGEDPDKALDFGDFHFSTYNVNHELLTDADLAELQHQGKNTNLFTINQVRRMQYFIDRNVQGIFTDYPQQIPLLNR